MGVASRLVGPVPRTGRMVAGGNGACLGAVHDAPLIGRATGVARPFPSPRSLPIRPAHPDHAPCTHRSARDGHGGRGSGCAWRPRAAGLRPQRNRKCRHWPPCVALPGGRDDRHRVRQLPSTQPASPACWRVARSSTCSGLGTNSTPRSITRDSRHRLNLHSMIASKAVTTPVFSNWKRCCGAARFPFLLSDVSRSDRRRPTEGFEPEGLRATVRATRANGHCVVSPSGRPLQTCGLRHINARLPRNWPACLAGTQGRRR